MTNSIITEVNRSRERTIIEIEMDDGELKTLPITRYNGRNPEVDQRGRMEYKSYLQGSAYFFTPESL